MGSIEKLMARSSVAFTMKSPAEGGFLILPPPSKSTQPPVEASTLAIFLPMTWGGSLAQQTSGRIVLLSLMLPPVMLSTFPTSSSVNTVNGCHSSKVRPEGSDTSRSK